MAASSQDRDASDGFSPRLATFYAAMFVFAGIVMPFFPVWLQAKGLDSRATGIVLAAPMLMRLVSVPLLARLADRWSAFRAALIAASVGSVLAYALLSQVAGFVPILLAVALASVATAPALPLTDAYALKGLGLRGRAYGPVRLWGSVAFVAANLGAGVGGFARAAAARCGNFRPGKRGCAGSQAAALAGLLGDHRGGEPDPGEPCGLLRLLGPRLAGEGP